MLVTVLLVTFVLLILVAGTMAYAVGSQPLSRRDQDWNAALSSAEAGLDDYLYRLNQNDQYYLYGAAPTTLACGTGLTLAAPPDGNLAFSQWVPVPGATSNTTFTYRVDTSCLSQGAVIVWSTGKAANVTRTVQATLRRRAFIDYLYFTDFETKDPAANTSADDYTPTEAQTYCALHYYEGRDVDSRTDFPGDTDGKTCTDINFVSGDTINGPLHSNDAILICGSPTFNGKVTTSWQGAGTPLKRYRSNTGGSCGTTNPTFANSGDPKYADPLTMPPSNTAIKVKADATLGGAGCLFTGPDVHHAERGWDDDGREPLHQGRRCPQQLCGRDESRAGHPGAPFERCDLRPERSGGPDRSELHRRLPFVDRAGRRGARSSSRWDTRRTTTSASTGARTATSSSRGR